MPSAVCTLYFIVCNVFAWSLHSSSGISFFLLQSDIIFEIIRSQYAAVSFISLIIVLLDNFFLSEIIISSKAAFSELNLSLSPYWVPPKLSFFLHRALLDVAKCF